jgi:toxin ParE1/3/4
VDIVWTDEAIADLIAIESHLEARFSRELAGHVIDDLFRRVDLLRDHPELGRVVPEYAHRQTRELIDRWNRVLYWLTAHGVEILKVASASVPLEPVDPIE